MIAGASLGAGVAGPLAVSVVRTTTGASARLGRPGAYLETELALSSPGGTLSGSATVRVDLAPRLPSLGDAARAAGGVLVTVVVVVGKAVWTAWWNASCLAPATMGSCQPGLA